MTDLAWVLPFIATTALAIGGFFLRGLSATMKELNLSLADLKTQLADLKTEVAVLRVQRGDYKGLEERIRRLEQQTHGGA